MTSRWALLCDGPGFLEAEISWPVIHGLADDHVIQELDLENPGCFANPTELCAVRRRTTGT